MDYSAITLEELASNRPDLVTALQSAGATSERERIQSIESLTLPGHEALVEQLKFDGKTSGPEAAVAVLQAEQKTGAAALAALVADAPAPAPSAEAPPATPLAYAEDEASPIEDRAKATWDHDAAIRAEFGSVESYTAFRKAEAGGRFKVLSGGKG